MRTNDVKLSDVLDVVVCGYVITYFHSNLPTVHTAKFHSKRALMHWIDRHKAELLFAGKPLFTIETIMKVVQKPEPIDKAINLKQF